MLEGLNSLELPEVPDQNGQMRLIMPGDYVELLNTKIHLATCHQRTHKT